MDRVILHVDMNNFYASVECLYDPKLKGVPMAVGGDPQCRHGIVLAKNMAAKKMGVRTGEALWEARQKCPGIVFVSPHFERYSKYSKKAREIYCQYTDQVENFGLDECWLDVTGSTKLFGSGREIAEEIRKRIKDELGLTVSVGVSFNKVFAKLGSDYKKPDAVTEFTRENFRDTVWKLPAADMIMVGPATEKVLNKYGIHTIGQLAETDPAFLRKVLGKGGDTIINFARGMDTSPVTSCGFEREIKSIGNSTTTPKDLMSDEDVKVTLYVLCESVAARLREKDLAAGGIQISVRNTELFTRDHQCVLNFPASDSDTIFRCAFGLYKEMGRCLPIRSVGVRAIKLVDGRCCQMSLYADEKRSMRRAELEKTVDALRARYGRDSVLRGVFCRDRDLSAVNPKDDHKTHPVGFVP